MHKPKPFIPALLFLATLLLPLHLTQASTPCHLLSSQNAIPQGSGASYNLFSAAKETLLKAFCDSDHVTLDFGNGQNTLLIYKEAYEWKNNAWQELQLEGPHPSGDWFVGAAKTDVPRTPAALSELNVYVAYLCQRTSDNSWKCGCRDSKCTSRNWSIQVFRVAPVDDPAPGDSGDLTYPTPAVASDAKYVKNFGAKGDGSTDDASALKDAFNAVKSGGQLVFEPKKTYALGNNIDFVGSNGVTVIGNGATLKMKDGVSPDSPNFMLRIREGRNFAIYDLAVDGNRFGRNQRKDRSGYRQGFSHNLMLSNVKDFRLVRVRSNNAVMDGIYVYSAGTSGTDVATYPERGLFHDIHTDNNWRNGLTIINGYDLVIEDSAFTNSNGDWPQAGLDIEPNAPSAVPGVKNVVIRRSTFTGNVGQGLKVVAHGQPTGLLIEDSYIANNTGQATTISSKDSIWRRNLIENVTTAALQNGKPIIRGVIDIPAADGGQNPGNVFSENALRNIKVGEAVFYSHSHQGDGNQVINNCIEDFSIPLLRNFKSSGFTFLNNTENPPGGCPDPRQNQ